MIEPATPATTSYDDVPYESRPFSQTHPQRLATIGRLFGLAPADVTACRVLELGCAAGGNLIPMAFHLPRSEFVGVDLSARQVATGHETIDQLGLGNVRIEQASIGDIDPSWGRFDYIISHGVYSWVADAVQERLLAVSAENLAPEGIAYVSYNTYPGWHMREMIRRMMLYHGSRFDSPGQRVEQGRALIDFLARSVPQENYFGMLLKTELELIKSCSDAYLFHDHLEETNEPLYFHQFIERAERHGLQYLGEADFSMMLTRGLGEEVASTLTRISDGIIQSEQYLDFVRARQFRQTLLCHAERSLKRDIDFNDVEDSLVASAAVAEDDPLDLTPGRRQRFRTPAGLTLETDYAVTKAALVELREIWPRALDTATLLRRSLDRLGPLRGDDEGRTAWEVLADDLLCCFASGAIEFHAWQADFVTEVSQRPRVSALAAQQAQRSHWVTNQRHEVVTGDPLALQLVRLLDGTRDRAALRQRITSLFDDGTLTLEQDGRAIDDETARGAAVAEALDQSLGKLAGAALLVA